ncbi:MAG TPA: hypothetical protein ENG15_01510 [Thermotoga sp.]|nr:hypothetical protein [Thermotoga sp.]
MSSDINDYHFYFSYPDNKKNWDKTIESFARGKFRTFYMRRKYSLRELFEMVEKKLKIPKSNFDLSKLPKIVSEFGCWGLPDPSLFVGDWFKYPIFDGKSVSDFIKEFEELYYRTPSEMAVDSQWKEFQTLKYEIESMRIHPEIAGYVLTELSDISWEANGVLDFDRNPKVFAPYLKWLNLDLLPIYRNGMIYISNVSSTDLRCRVIAKLDGEKILDEKLTVKSFDVWKRRLDFEGGGLLDLEILDEQGRTVGRNFYNLVRWKKVKFSVQKGIKANILKRVENGETILVQLNEEGEYLDGKVRVYSSKTPAFGFDSHWANWSGDWIGAFYYYHPSLIDLLSPYLGGMELSDLLGDKIIISEEGKILIGKYIGWNMAKCGYLVEIKFGKGRLLLATLKLEDTELGKKIIERLKIQE